MKRMFFIDILIIGLMILVGWTWSLHDQSEYADRLDHLGISEQATELTTTSRSTLRSTTSALAHLKATNFEVQFQPKGTAKQPVYVFAKGSQTTLPLDSGQWFSDADLQSSLLIAVVGRNRADQLAAGSSQKYYVLGNRYVPVLGVVGTRGGNALNNTVMFNASAANAAAPKLNHVRIVIDGPSVKNHLKAFKKVFHSTRSATYRYHNAVTTTWWQSNGGTLLRCAGLGALTVFLAFLTVVLLHPTIPLGDRDALTGQYTRQLWLRASSHSSIAAIVGLAISWWQFYFTNVGRMLGAGLIVWLLYVILLRIGIGLTIRRQERIE